MGEMGDINVFTGPMKCGKTHIILQEAKKQLIAGKHIQIFKPEIDNRFSEDYVQDRNGNKLKAVNINNINEIADYDADVYIIDEFQFLDGDVGVIEKLAQEGKKFFIAGLNLTAEKKPFGKMGDLMCIADKIEIMTSICDICKSDDAIYTYYNGKKDEDILIGDSEYIPVCRSCYNYLIEHKEKPLRKKIINF